MRSHKGSQSLPPWRHSHLKLMLLPSLPTVTVARVCGSLNVQTSPVH
jgi:hypothetical protein